MLKYLVINHILNILHVIKYFIDSYPILDSNTLWLDFLANTFCQNHSCHLLRPNIRGLFKFDFSQNESVEISHVIVGKTTFTGRECFLDSSALCRLKQKHSYLKFIILRGNFLGKISNKTSEKEVITNISSILVLYEGQTTRELKPNTWKIGVCFPVLLSRCFM